MTVHVQSLRSLQLESDSTNLATNTMFAGHFVCEYPSHVYVGKGLVYSRQCADYHVMGLAS